MHNLNYRDSIVLIKKKLEEKTMGEIENEMGLNLLDYTGIGYGYRFKDSYPKTMAEAFQFTETPLLDEIERSIAMGI